MNDRMPEPQNTTIRSEYLAQMLRTLWPEPAVIDRRHPFKRLGGRDGTAEFFVLPNDRRPKLVLPRRPWRVAAAAIRNYKMYATGRARLEVLAVAASVRLGGGELLPAQFIITNAVSDIVDYVSTALGQRCHVCIYIGPPRAVQKPVLQILSSAGETIGFAKVGASAKSRILVSAEAENLTLLGRQDWQTVVTPQVLHSGTWCDLPVLVQEALLRRRAQPVGPDLLVAATLEIATMLGTVRAPLHSSDYWSQLSDRIRRLPPTHDHVLIEDTLRELIARCAGAQLTFGAWHGDWGPWNMAASGQRMLVWDWEHFQQGVPLGFDAIHHDVHSAVLRATEPIEAFVATADRAPKLLEPFDVPPGYATLTVLLYAVDIAVRYLEDGERELNGTAMGRLEWLDATLPRLLAKVH